MTKFHTYSRQAVLFKTALTADHRHGSLKNHGLPTHQPQLRHSFVMCTGFAQALAIQVSDLVGSDDDGLWELGGYRLGFGKGQTLSQYARGFLRQRGFVYIGCSDLKRNVQALQQLTPVARCRAQNELANCFGRRRCKVHGLDSLTLVA